MPPDWVETHRFPSLGLGRRRPLRAYGRALEQQLALAGVAGESRGAFELRTSLAQAAELSQEIAANAGQEVVVLKRRVLGQHIHQLEAGLWTKGHGDGHGAVQFHNRRWHELGES